MIVLKAASAELTIPLSGERSGSITAIPQQVTVQKGKQQAEEEIQGEIDIRRTHFLAP